MGTKVLIEGTKSLDGVWTIQDRMNKRWKHRIDFLVNKDIKAGKWENIKITIIK
jgi:3D (Asp-Asp-Asp) domain-containing protein